MHDVADEVTGVGAVSDVRSAMCEMHVKVHVHDADDNANESAGSGAGEGCRRKC